MSTSSNLTMPGAELTSAIARAEGRRSECDSITAEHSEVQRPLRRIPSDTPHRVTSRSGVSWVRCRFSRGQDATDA